MTRVTLEDMENLFESFQNRGMVDAERNRTQGMFIRLGRTANKEEDLQMLEQIERLIYVSEREGFRNGFEAAFRLGCNKSRHPMGTVVDMDLYIKK